MLHIVKKEKGYMLVAIAKNGEVLNTSEVLSSKQKCFDNAKSLLKECFSSLADYLWPGVIVQDDTLPKPKVWLVTYKKRLAYPNKPEPKYIPGKNKTTKKK